ncbi:MAG: NAD(P)H-hydrate dehydratase [Opitutaceae bacterium]|nr:NAD(P)H-hydrate dehydratase [Opitutaceae bacterium]
MRAEYFENSDPVLSCKEAGEYENSILNSDEKIWDAMAEVGRKLGQGILKEYSFSRYSKKSLSILGLIGKGHNGGDALLGIDEMTRVGSVGIVTLLLICPESTLKPYTARSLEQLKNRVPEDRLAIFESDDDVSSDWHSEIEKLQAGEPFDICLDGLIGMQFRPPTKGPTRKVIEFANKLKDIRLRVAVDLPSGLGDEADDLCFKADVTFATGILKSPLLKEGRDASIGSIRYLDIGLFNDPIESKNRVLNDSTLNLMRKRRPVHVDKRFYGHLFILAGSREMPGALLMSIRAALLSGVGLVTVCAPAGIVPALAPLVPEAMWVSWPESPSGGLSSNGLDYIRTIQSNASAILVGPGMGNDPETVNLLVELLKRWTGSIVIDADALQPRVLHWVQGVCIVTPHLGEFKRILGLEGNISDVNSKLQEFAQEHSIIVALKGAMTRISDGESLYLNTTGNSVLARGGSGDLLAGLAAGILAQSPQNALSAACRAVCWHGKAADLLASRKGQVAVRTTDMLEYLGEALCVEEERIDE